MNALINSVKRYFLFALLVLFLIFLLWLRLFIAPKVSEEEKKLGLSPTPIAPEIILTPVPTIAQSRNVLPSSSLVYQYQGPSFSPPSLLPVLKPKKSLVINKEKAVSLALQFGFSSSPTLEEIKSQEIPFYLWQEKNRSFSVGGSFPVVYFNDYSLLSSSSPVSFNQEEIVEKTQEELNKLSLEKIDYQSPVFEYYQAVANEATKELELKKTSKDNASFIEVKLTYLFQGFPVITNVSAGFPLRLVFDSSANLLELTAYIFDFEESLENISFSSFDSLVSSLDKNAVILFAYSQNEDLENVFSYDFSTVNLTSSSVYYYAPSQYTDKIYPCCLFAGQAEDKKTKNEIKVTVLLPVTDLAP